MYYLLRREGRATWVHEEDLSLAERLALAEGGPFSIEEITAAEDAFLAEQASEEEARVRVSLAVGNALPQDRDDDAL
jgi:hypothetical protein